MSKTSGGGALRTIGCFAVAALVLTCGLGMGVTMGRHAIVTAIARSQLRERGVECDARFALEVSLTLDQAIAAPTACTFASGPVATLELVDPVSVGMANGMPTGIEGGAARLELRGDAPQLGPSGWGAIYDALSIPERIGTMVAGFGELARAGAPPIALRSVDVQRGGRPIISLAGLRADGGSPLAITVSRAELPSIAGPMGASAHVAMSDVRSSATASQVTMDAQLEIDASMPMIGSLDQRRPVHVVVEGLDTTAPRWSVQ